MRIAIVHRHFIVIDDLIEKSRFELLHESLKRAKYRAYSGWSSVWSLDEQGAYRCSPFKSGNVTRDFGDPASVAYSILTEGVNAVLDDVEYLTGKHGHDWGHFNGNAVLFPPGGALNWHSDKKYVASYTYYCQSDWQRRWGGELLVLEDGPPHWSPPETGDAGSSQDSGVVSDVGYFVAPVANRLVVIRGATPHRIAAVSAAAGENHRMSITGFFVKGDPGERDEA